MHSWGFVWWVTLVSVPSRGKIVGAGKSLGLQAGNHDHFQLGVYERRAQDFFQITMTKTPCFYNPPEEFIVRVAGNLSYIDLLSKAALCWSFLFPIDSGLPLRLPSCRDARVCVVFSSLLLVVYLPNAPPGTCTHPYK